MADLDSVVSRELANLDLAQLRRELRDFRRPAGGTRRILDSNGRALLSFASNDYLGLAAHPAVRDAASRAIQEEGAGSTASRLVCGSLNSHRALDQELATFKRMPAALSFSSGYATALGVVPALIGPGDFVVLDRLAHASLVDAARLSGAKLRVFRHNDVADLERILAWADSQPGRHPTGTEPAGNLLIVTESVFSMDGDLAPLREIAALKARHGAWLMVDEAHATGVVGPGGRGLIEELGLGPEVEVAMGTLGKALGAAGGFVTGSRILCDFLVNRARSFVFSTAPTPATVAAACEALRILASPEGEVLLGRLWQRIGEMHRGLLAAGWRLPTPVSAILPLMVGSEEAAVRLADVLREEGVFVPGIRFPTVPRGKARLRVTLSAAHEPGDVDAMLAALRRAMDRTGIRPES